MTLGHDSLPRTWLGWKGSEVASEGQTASAGRCGQGRVHQAEQELVIRFGEECNIGAGGRVWGQEKQELLDTIFHPPQTLPLFVSLSLSSVSAEPSMSPCPNLPHPYTGCQLTPIHQNGEGRDLCLHHLLPKITRPVCLLQLRHYG